MFAELLRTKLAGICDLTDSQVDRMRQHYELLCRWNKVLNLTSVRSIEEAVERHYCESVFGALHLPGRVNSIADIGSGAGFPGIPIAILHPQASVTLIESHQRKAAFLAEATRDLPNVRVVASRAEDVQDSYEWAVSRAVRFSEIARALRSLAESAELLTGEVCSEEMHEFTWRKPIRLPWGDRRYLWLGTRVSPVSRGT